MTTQSPFETFTLAEIYRQRDVDRVAPYDTYMHLLTHIDAANVDEFIDALRPDLRDAFIDFVRRQELDTLIPESIGTDCEFRVPAWRALQGWLQRHPDPGFHQREEAKRAERLQARAMRRARARARLESGEDLSWLDPYRYLTLHEQGRVVGEMSVRIMRAEGAEEKALLQRRLQILREVFEERNLGI